MLLQRPRAWRYPNPTSISTSGLPLNPCTFEKDKFKKQFWICVFDQSGEASALRAQNELSDHLISELYTLCSALK